MTPLVRAALDRWLMNPPELEEEEYCEDGRCGACPGCQRAQDEADRGDWLYEQKRDREFDI